MIEAASAQAIDRAARLLIEGELLAFATETVYGLGADAAQRKAIEKVYALKGRPADHPLIVHVSDLEQALKWAQFDERALQLARAFWPGPLTLILPRRVDAPEWACGGQPSIGLRCPSHPVAQALLARFVALGGSGVAAPSANRFGKVSPTTAQHVLDDLGADAPLILDGGPCEVGVESSIVDLTRAQPALLRPGRIRRADIEAVLGETLAGLDEDAPRASGTLTAHYSPSVPVELVSALELDARVRQYTGQGLSLGVWSIKAPAAPILFWLQASEDALARESALYAALRDLDQAGPDRILVEAPPSRPDWEAVSDRLLRAAAAGGGADRLARGEPG